MKFDYIDLMMMEIINITTFNFYDSEHNNALLVLSPQWHNHKYDNDEWLFIKMIGVYV